MAISIVNWIVNLSDFKIAQSGDKFINTSRFSFHSTFTQEYISKTFFSSHEFHTTRVIESWESFISNTKGYPSLYNSIIFWSDCSGEGPRHKRSSYMKYFKTRTWFCLLMLLVRHFLPFLVHSRYAHALRPRSHPNSLLFTNCTNQNLANWWRWLIAEFRSLISF